MQLDPSVFIAAENISPLNLQNVNIKIIEHNQIEIIFNKNNVDYYLLLRQLTQYRKLQITTNYYLFKKIFDKYCILNKLNANCEIEKLLTRQVQNITASQKIYIANLKNNAKRNSMLCVF
ncbi:hypothetical protein [Metamycoplasma equirhinis]|uniref:hypothetical protein n=1 Tax=Metamycoplasma equirhinis TaxID=92402 RepID=UPI0035932BB5